MLALSVALHALAAIVWVGGMGFAYWYLRPAAGPLDGPVRLGLWQRVFARFFVWVWIAAILLPVTGYVMVWGQWGGMGSMPLHAHLMQGLGWVMIVLFLYLWFVPYRRFKAALTAGDPPTAAAALDRIRLIVKTNLAIGLINAAIGASGRYWTL